MKKKKLNRHIWYFNDINTIKTVAKIWTGEKNVIDKLILCPKISIDSN